MKRILLVTLLSLFASANAERFSVIPRIGIEASYVTPNPIMFTLGAQLGYAEGPYQARIGIETNPSMGEVSLQADVIYTFYAQSIQGYFGAGGHQIFYGEGEEDQGSYLIVGSRFLTGFVSPFVEAQPVFRLEGGFRLRVLSGIEFSF
jgi:hypothetical protein